MSVAAMNMKLKAVKAEDTELGKTKAEMKKAMEVKQVDLKAERKRSSKRNQRIERLVKRGGESGVKRKANGEARAGDVKLKGERVEESHGDE